MEKLNPKQRKAISLFVTGASLRVIAKEVPVNLKTLYRWLEKPEFVAALKDATTLALGANTARLTMAVSQAIDTLINAMKNATSESQQIRAAGMILDYSLKFQEITDLSERLAALEEKVNEN